MRQAQTEPGGVDHVGIRVRRVLVRAAAEAQDSSHSVISTPPATVWSSVRSVKDLFLVRS